MRRSRRIRRSPPRIDRRGKVRFLDQAEESRLRNALLERDVELRNLRTSGNLRRQHRHEKLLSLLPHFGDHLTPAVLLSMNTGLRRGEVLKLRWTSVDFNRRLLTVEGGNAKNRQTRHVPLNEEAVSVSRLNRSISNGLSIRGVFEVASFRPGKAVEAEPESLSPPVFEISPMLTSRGFNLRAVWRQLGRVRFSGQDGCAKGVTSRRTRLCVTQFLRITGIAPSARARPHRQQDVYPPTSVPAFLLRCHWWDSRKDRASPNPSDWEDRFVRSSLKWECRAVCITVGSTKSRMN
jgi:integrase-like protein